MGPSVKFVSPNKGLISKKKMGVNFFRVKNDQTGGGECQSLSVTFTLRTSLLDVLGRPYMMSCKIFKVF